MYNCLTKPILKMYEEPRIKAMQAVFEKLPSNTLRGRIAEKMQQAILTGALREGEKLVERKLAAQFETSLTAVREALSNWKRKDLSPKSPMPQRMSLNYRLMARKRYLPSGGFLRHIQLRKPRTW